MVNNIKLQQHKFQSQCYGLLHYLWKMLLLYINIGE